MAEMMEVTGEEREKILKSSFSSLEPPKLRQYSSKGKKRIVVLEQLSGLFEKGKEYSEKEINALLAPVYEDYVTLRRDLVETKHLERTPDGKTYRAL